MAIVNLTFHSYYLGTEAQVTILLPEALSGPAEDRKGKIYPVLYLLHGHSNDGMTYATSGNVPLLCRDLDLIVVMPSAGRSFYVNGKYGYRYYDYMTKELPVVIQNYFPVSVKREDTYIAGLSMGGYGAFMMAMKNPERFGAAASMSGAIDAAFRLRHEEMTYHKCVDMRENLEHIFGSAKEYDSSEWNLYGLLKTLENSQGPKPRFFQCCGLEDELLEQNRQMNRALEAAHMEHEYKESHGIHNWYYWNKSLPDVLEFFGFQVKRDTYN